MENGNSMKNKSQQKLTRKAFIKTATLVSATPVLSMIGASKANAQAKNNPSDLKSSESNARLGDEYLEKGLIGLARGSHNGGWFPAHWGANMIAAYYICKENDIDEQTVLTTKKKVGSHDQGSSSSPVFTLYRGTGRSKTH